MFDIECNTPAKWNRIKFNEILELPMVVLDTKTNKFIGEFHTFVRPTIDNQIGKLCRKITGITKEIAFWNQRTGRANPILWEALDMMHDFLGRIGVLGRRFALVQYGGFDARQLTVEATHKNIPVRDYYTRWIDIHKIFPPMNLLKSRFQMHKYKFE